MTEQNPPIWLQSGTYRAVDDRLITSLMSERDRGKNGAGGSVMGGVVPGWGQMQVTAPGTGMTVNISDGTAMVPSVGVSPAGAYVVHNAGNKAVTLTPETSANPRFDLVYIEVLNKEKGDSSSEWRIAVKQGVASASPKDPVLPVGTIPLARVRVIPAAQHGGANKITNNEINDIRIMLTSIGGVHHVKSGMPNPPYANGRLIYNESNNHLYLTRGLRADGTNNYEYLYTYQQWMTLFAALRPWHTSGNTAVVIPSGTASWDQTPAKDGHSGSIEVVKLAGMKTPSGAFKISISAYGHVSDAGGHGHLSVVITQGTTHKFEPKTDWRSISFYGKGWEHHGTTFMATGLPKNTPLDIRLAFYKAGTASVKAYFSNYYLMAEPVL